MYRNVLVNKKASASSIWSYFYPPLAVDGNTTYDAANRWVSGTPTGPGEWLQVELGGLARIDKMTLYTGNTTDGTTISNAIANGDFQVNSSSGGWTTVASFRDNPATNGKVELTFTAVTTDKVRIYFPILESSYRIFELEAYGEFVGKKAATPKATLATPKSFQYARGQNLLDMGSSLWTKRSGTTYFTRSGNRFTLDVNADYAGLNHVFPEGLLPGKTVTWGGTGSSEMQIMLYWLTAAGTGVYMSADTGVKTVTVPSDATQVRFYVQNSAGTRNNAAYVENIFLCVASSATFSPYVSRNTIANLTEPKQNLLQPMGASPWITNVSSGNYAVTDGYTLKFTAAQSGWYYSQQVPVKQGMLYTISVEDITANGRVAIREVKADNSKVYLTDLLSTKKTYTYKPSSTTVKVEVDCTYSAAGDVTYTQPMLVEGLVKPTFQPYTLGNRRMLE